MQPLLWLSNSFVTYLPSFVVHDRCVGLVWLR
jgi:hypothetical protein